MIRRLLLQTLAMSCFACFGIAVLAPVSVSAQTKKSERHEPADKAAKASKAPVVTPVGPNEAGVDDKGIKFLPSMQTGFGGTPEAASYGELCRNVRVENRDDLDFSDMETRLLCGDGAGGEIGAPWSKIPPNQAAYFITGFLQTRGYHAPTFIQDGETLFVKPGPLSRLGTFRILNGPPDWAPPRRRLVEGDPLTPSLLDDLEGWALSQIKNEGYACATGEGRADPVTGEAISVLTPGNLKRITNLENVGETGLDRRVLNRYNAFLIGDIYRERLISLTRRRITDDGFLQTIVLTARCEEGDNVTIVRDIVLGPSRIVRIGVGGSTDEGARVRAIVRQNRIGSYASSAQVRANVAYLNENVNRQTVDANFRWSYSPEHERRFIEPALILEHLETTAFETQTEELRLGHGWGHETTDGQFEFRVGPTMLNSFQPRGVGPEKSTTIFAESNARWTQHDFEWFATSPRTGEYLDATVLVTTKNWGANFTAQKLQVTGQKLWSIGRFDPPLLILGTRFNISSVFSPDDNVTSDLPVRFLTFLGGERDLRGFDQASLPLGGVGSLSGITASFEARLHRVIIRRLDPFAFVDAGQLGGAEFQLQQPIFLSPGIGMRWESPVGTLRGYVAQRFAINEPEGAVPIERQLRFGFTFGEEF